MAVQFLKRFANNPVLLVSPETGLLPHDMGTVARFISGKRSGLGKVIMALCGGLTERGIEFHLTNPNQEFR